MDAPNRRQLIVTKTSLKAPKTDTAYWRTQPYTVRLAALEQIRQEYHQWKYNVQPGFQRVYQKAQE
jgi:hypothetical protein